MKKARKPRRKKPSTTSVPPSGMVEFPEVKGKTIEEFKLFLHVDDTSLSLKFSDRTYLYMDLEPGLTVRTKMDDCKTSNGRPIKVWPKFERESFWFEEPF